METKATQSPVMISQSRTKRWLFAIAGVTCFVLAIIGALVPGMPTTVFVLIGGYCLLRSCPWMADRFLSLPLLRPYAHYINNPTTPLPQRVRTGALVAMTTSVAISLFILHLSDRLTLGVGVVIGVLWVSGAIAILMFRRA